MVVRIEGGELNGPLRMSGVSKGGKSCEGL